MSLSPFGAVTKAIPYLLSSRLLQDHSAAERPPAVEPLPPPADYACAEHLEETLR
uniref:hypothetical protein n=1 Tax=Streptomyces sp. F12 TaxID=1436084 RepID=UPI0015E85FAB|nr:hypothetical protein [Streptomyces sp. F12]